MPLRSTIGEGVYREFAGSLQVCKVGVSRVKDRAAWVVAVE